MDDLTGSSALNTDHLYAVRGMFRRIFNSIKPNGYCLSSSCPSSSLLARFVTPQFSVSVSCNMLTLRVVIFTICYGHPLISLLLLPIPKRRRKKKGKEKKKVPYYDQLSFSILFMCLGIAGFFFLFVAIMTVSRLR